MVQWLGALAVLSEDLVWFLASTQWPTMICNSSNRESDTFCPTKTPDMHVVHRHTCRQNIHIHDL